MFRPTEDDTYILESFQGPLDYLVYLIQKKEIDLTDVAIGTIITQYLSRLEDLTKDAVDKGAEFIGTTATLVYLKSKLLLPPKEEENDPLLDQEDPSFAIIHHLLEYVRIKEAANHLSDREDRGGVYTRGPAEPRQLTQKMGIEHLPLTALHDAFSSALAESESRKGSIHEESWRVSDKIRSIKNTLSLEKKIPFTNLFSENKGKIELIVTFLALLELMKEGFASISSNNNTHFITQPNHG